ncbi:MAG: ThiF family adenylyltransferase [Candidatus Binatia bacterium]
MPLSDHQIERYSRQIILAQIGGTGQQRLLNASAAVAGDGPLAAMIARYLVGAGVGRLTLLGADAAVLRLELTALNPDSAVVVDSAVPPGADVVAAAELAPESLAAMARSMRRAEVPLIGTGARGAAGWVHVAVGGRGCVVCAAGAAAALCAPALEAPLATVLGGLAAALALNLLLGLAAPEPGTWWQFETTTSALQARELRRAADCPACG